MTTHYYFNPRTWNIAVAEAPQPGKVKLGGAGALLLTPIVGAIFLMFLPVIGFVLLGQALLTRAKGGLASWAASQALPMAAPGSAYLQGAPTAPGANAKARPPEGDLADVEREVEKRRRG